MGPGCGGGARPGQDTAAYQKYICRAQGVNPFLCMVVKQICIQASAAEEFLSDLQRNRPCFNLTRGKIDISYLFPFLYDFSSAAFLATTSCAILLFTSHTGPRIRGKSGRTQDTRNSSPHSGHLHVLAPGAAVILPMQLGLWHLNLP